MKYPLTFFLLFFVFLNFTGFSQHKNSVKLYTQGLNFMSSRVQDPSLSNNGFEDFELNSIIGISYEREIKNGFGVGAQYALWWGKPLRNVRDDSGWMPVSFSTFTFLDDTAAVGELLQGNNYNTYDIYGIYTFKLKEKLKMAFKAGPSVTKGENLYLKNVWLRSPEPGSDYYILTTSKKETYFGGIASMSFDYIFWNDRIPVGLDFVSRFYHNFPFQLNYGLHAGFSF
jgi:hypothetical protein